MRAEAQRSDEAQKKRKRLTTASDAKGMTVVERTIRRRVQEEIQ